MQPKQWPHHLDDVWAKSPVDNETKGESLAQHTWLVLARLADLQRLRPDLPQLVNTPDLWHCLFWTCLLHDLGKAAHGFQAMLRPGGPRYGHRHEVLSLMFVDWIAGGLSEDERQWIIAAIASHHRDEEQIRERYNALADPDPVVTLAADIAPDVVSGLWHWIDECAPAWIEALGLTECVRPLSILPHDKAVASVRQQGARRVRFWLGRYKQFVADLSLPDRTRQVTLSILLRGLTTSADHIASAHLPQLPDAIQLSWEQLAGRILKPGQQPYHHQRTSAAQTGHSTILIAPPAAARRKRRCIGH